MIKGLYKTILFTDLDGTLLDFKTYSAELAKPVFQKANSAGVPIIFCSSKTYAEQLPYLKELTSHHPIIVENGSAIFIPKNYFSTDIAYNNIRNDYAVIEFGISSGSIIKVFDSIRAKLKFNIRRFDELSVKEVSNITGLNYEAAQRAIQRDYSITFNSEDPRFDNSIMNRELDEYNLISYPGGRFFTITSKNADKGKAVKALTSLYQREYGEIKTIGIGDSYNDFPMLRSVDAAYLVQNPEGNWADIELDNLKKIDAVGPRGWIKIVDSII